MASPHHVLSYKVKIALKDSKNLEVNGNALVLVICNHAQHESQTTVRPNEEHMVFN